MFGVGLREIILIAIIVAVVWYLCKVIAKGKVPTTIGMSGAPKNSSASTTELHACIVCDVYLITDSMSCGAPNCPYPKE